MKPTGDGERYAPTSHGRRSLWPPLRDYRAACAAAFEQAAAGDRGMWTVTRIPSK